ncbi:hypothetical protein M569_07519, partial [Genlisea aurea]
LHSVARDAFEHGKKILSDLKSGKLVNESDRVEEPCENSLVISGVDFAKKGNMVELPCGLSLGSHITVVGRPRSVHVDHDSKINLSMKSGGSSEFSQFVLELRGLKAVDGEEPPKILHFNPRLKGDWSGHPVIELNTCYRMQWGSSQRCVGWRSRADEEKVDGKVKCEKWIHDDTGSEESKVKWWLSRLVGRTNKVIFDWPFPFVENKLFVLTLIAGLEGYHINVDGRHVSSFPYRPGFTLEDATGLFLDGNVEVNSIVATSLPILHPSTAPKRHLDISPEWKSPKVLISPLELFIGILSAGNHFAERMAIRKSWMQYDTFKTGNAVARFFVALHNRDEVNLELMKEADYFGDIVIVPYLDNYELVVLKTIAICDYAVHQVAAKCIMKCDDDTFIRIDAVMMEINKIRSGKSFYVGNINYHLRPLRHGKWRVTYEEWPEESYPAYANGPGYVISSDIAEYVVSEFEKHKLRLFKMEDVSMGMWVKKWNISRPVDYIHSLRFCQFGCIEGYYTAHYQSPKQMTCLWKKWKHLGEPRCCNVK